MKLSEVFRKAAEEAFNCPKRGWYGCFPCRDEEAEFYFRWLIGDCYGEQSSPMFADVEHRSTALCMAASIAESEGL